MPQSLVAASIGCAQLLNQASSLLHDTDCEERSAVSRSGIEDQSGRFRIWAGNLGAFQSLPATSSLDHRLGDSPRVAMRVLKILRDVEETLKDIMDIASGKRPNRRCMVDEDQEGTDLLTHDLDDGEEDSVNAYIYEGQELFEALKEAIGSLFRISIVVRDAGLRHHFVKAVASISETPVSDVDTRYVGLKFPKLDKSGKLWLKDRLARAMSYRRQHIQRAHISNTTRYSPQGQYTDLYKQSTSTSSPSTSWTLGIDELALQEEDDDEPDLQLPGLDLVAKGSSSFECPICWTTQNITSEKAWRKHANSDLQPYVCTFIHCDNKSFSTSRDWFQHEMENHRVRWRCPWCEEANFRSLQLFGDHLEQQHGLEFTESQLDALSEASKQTAEHISAAECPFCDNWATELRAANLKKGWYEAALVEASKFKHHVGSHMQQLALFAVPLIKKKVELGRIAIAGTCGLALLIAREISWNTGAQLVILSRNAQPNLISQGYNCIIVDYNDATSLQHVLMGVDIVISTVPGNNQLRLIEAAVSCRVRRFIPAEFEGEPNLQLKDSTLDSGRSAALALLQHYKAYLESTIIVCGILYERFSVNGMKSHHMSASRLCGEEGDYILDAREMTALAPMYDESNALCRVGLTAADDVATFLVRALELESWPATMSICGQRLTVLEVMDIVQDCRGRKFVDVEYCNVATLEYQMTMAQLNGDLKKQHTILPLIATAKGYYDVPEPGYLNTKFPDIKTMDFKEWFANNWKDVP